MKFGVGQWVQIQGAGLLPGKLIQQLNGATQRLLGQQSLAGARTRACVQQQHGVLCVEAAGLRQGSPQHLLHCAVPVLATLLCSLGPQPSQGCAWM